MSKQCIEYAFCTSKLIKGKIGHNIMKLINLVTVLVLGVISASANAATIFQASDGNINVADTTIGGSFAIFDNETALNDGTSLLEIIKGDKIVANGTAPDSVVSLTNVRTSVTLDITDSNFVFGASTTSGSPWTLGTGTELYFAGSDHWNITFADLGPELKVVVDIQAIPVPAAVWLFGSGLIGLIGIARRKA